MGVCSSGECIKSYFFEREVYIQGNKIFKPINTNLGNDNEQLSPEEKQSLDNCKKLLEDIENKRKEIAQKFENFLFYTGGCVLTQPSLERGLITYVINLLTQIIICSKEKSVEFNKDDFVLSSFITFSKTPPFLEINNETLNNLKNKYGFDFNMIESLVKGKESIIDFISTVPTTEGMIQNQVEVLKSIAKENVKDFAMLKRIRNSIDGILFLINYFSEITNGILDTQLKLTKPRKIETYFKIASKASERKIKDPKEIALLYAYGDNCGKIENWKENITYKEMDPIKY